MNDPSRLTMALHPSAKTVLGANNLAFTYGDLHKALRCGALSSSIVPGIRIVMYHGGVCAQQPGLHLRPPAQGAEVRCAWKVLQGFLARVHRGPGVVVAAL